MQTLTKLLNKYARILDGKLAIGLHTWLRFDVDKGHYYPLRV